MNSAVDKLSMSRYSFVTSTCDATTLLHEAPWTVVYPGLAILLTVLALNLIGDGLREVLDPKRLKGTVYE